MKLSKIALIVMLVISIAITIARYISLQEENTQNIEYLTSLYAERVSTIIAEAASATEVLDALLVANKGNIGDSEVTTMMSLAYDAESHIAIAYMPNGIITKVYPVQGNEASLGYNVFNDENAKNDAITAMETRETAYSGPYKLMTGTTGLVARNPIYFKKDGKEVFWGFVAAIIRPSETFLKNSGLKNLEDIGYEYSVESNYNGTHVNLYSSHGFSIDLAEIYYDFQIGQSTWQITMYQNGIQRQILFEVFLITFAMLAFTTLIVLAFRQSEIKQTLAHTQSLTDPLTSLYNKRALLKYEERQNKQQSDDSYSIFYIDLNKFKPVNDTYGHEIGDKLLALFSERLSSQFRKDTFISRVGGDEFVIVFPIKQDELQCTHVKERLLRISEDPFFIDNHTIHISCSIGYASYPLNGKNFAEVLTVADKNMFEYKQKHKKDR